MLTVVVVLLVALVVRRVVVLRRSWGPTRRTAAIALTLAVAALVTAAVPEARHDWVQSRATAVVVEVSGVPGAVARCQRFTPDLLDLGQQSGSVAYGSRTAALRRTVCNDLAGWLLSDRSAPTLAQVRAVHVVVHEAMHVRGEFDEARAECAAMQRDAAAAELLGATPAQAEALAQTYDREIYPRMQDGYTSPACVEGGQLDETPGDGRFP